jgi:NAD-dependent DNA ligase
MQPEDLDFNLILADPAQYARDLTISELEEHLMLFKNYYYNTDTPLVPDHVYDEMEDILREKAPQSKVLLTVGAPLLPSQRKTKLPFPMASQDKAKAESGDLGKWLSKSPNSEYLVSDKLDGISLMYHYVRGKPAKLYTRGTTFEGQDVSHLLKHGLQIAETSSNRLKIPRDREEVAIRGELIMAKEVWEEFYADDYPNVRNWIAGQVAHKTSQQKNVSRIRFVAYQMVVPDNILPIDQFEIMKNWGFFTSPAKVYCQKELTESKMIEHLKSSKSQNPYQIDGLVITANKTFSPTEENPKDSIAFKSQIGEEVQVTVTHVEWNASKRGYLKPIVHIEPVFLSGAKISKASGNNAKFIVDNVIGPGATVEIIRSGEVIPYIMGVIEPAESGKPDLPEDLDYKWSPNQVDFIIKEESQQMTEKRLLHFAKTIQIDNLGPGTIKKIYEYTDVREPIDLLDLTLTELEEIPSLGKNAPKIYNSLQNVIKKRGVGLAQLIDAFGVFGTTGGIGTRRIQSVLDVMPNLLEEIPEPDFTEKLLQVEGIKEKTAEPMAKGLKMFVAQIYPKLPKELIITDFLDNQDSESSSSDSASSVNPKMKGFRFIFTGLRATPEILSLIKKSGGTTADTVLKTNSNQIVIAKDPTGNSGKIKKARDLNLKILSMDEFNKEFNV